MGSRQVFCQCIFGCKKCHSQNLSLFKLLLAPWLCKALWAPLVDKRATKQKWLLWSVSGLVFISAFATLSSPTNLFVLSFIVFFLNFFAATQDIAVDGIAVALLTSDELGKGNTAQVVGYKIGSIFGGGGFGVVHGFTGMVRIIFSAHVIVHRGSSFHLLVSNTKELAH